MENLSQKQAMDFCCEPLPQGGGFTWSLTTVLGKFLREAEQEYGPRDTSWKILGIEFGGDIPQLWFPGNCRHISIKLADVARLNPIVAQFELAHETVHLLAPTGTGIANNLEEGVATIFAHKNSLIRSDQLSYLNVEKLVSLLLATDPFAILKLRAKRPAFSDFTPDFILQHYPHLSESVAKTLCEPFRP